MSVVMPFAGDQFAARAAQAVLLGLDTRPEDELILVDNSGTAPELAGITTVRATAEQSPAHARNAGAAQARRDWLLFLDADCLAPAHLIDAYFAEEIADRIGALAGEVVPAEGAQTLAGRYGAARDFLGQRQHLSHPYRPRAVAANLLVRRAAFEQVGGFYEGLRAAEDTDFSWRLQQAGWLLEGRPQAFVEHRYRATLRELRRQWRGYAAGRAWLARRYDDFAPEPAVTRGARRLRTRARRLVARAAHPKTAASSLDGLQDRARRTAPGARAGRFDRGRYLAVDALLAGEELAGLALSNRPAASRREGPVQVVLIAERFPAVGDPLIDFARTLDGARVEAIARPEAVAGDAAQELWIDYREDDGAMLRTLATVRLAASHPIRCLLDVIRRKPGDTRLSALAPAVRRLGRDPDARVQPLGGRQAEALARRLAALAGRPLDQTGS